MGKIMRLFSLLSIILVIAVAAVPDSEVVADSEAVPESVVTKEQAPIVLAAAAAASPSCISEAEHDSALQKIQSLETTLANVEDLEDELDQVRSQLETITKEKAVSEATSAKLFQRAQELEEAQTRLQADLDNSSDEVSSCKSEVQTLSHSSAALTSCQSKVQSAQDTLSQCTAQSEASKAEAETAQRKLREKEQSFQNDVQNLKALMQKAEAKHKAEKEAFEAKLVAAKKELIKVSARLEKVAQDGFLFSLAQFKRTVAKVAALNKAVAGFVVSKVQPMLPPTLSDDIHMYYTQAKLASMGLYKSHVEPKMTTVSVMASPHVATVRRLYSQHAAEPINQARQTVTSKASTAWEESKLQAQKYYNVASQWTESNVIQPFVQSHPAVQELIPDAPVDRLFAVLYLLAVMFVLACVVRILFRCAVRPLLRTAKCAACMPCRITSCMFGGRKSCTSAAKKTENKKTSASKVVKKDSAPVKKEASPKKDDKKSASKKA